MTFDVPDDRRYTADHEWVAEHDAGVRLGITDFAQDELGDVVFVELPGEGAEIAPAADFAVVESIKAVSDVYAPVGGTVTATNDALLDTPELLNEDPYGEGWLVELDPDGSEGDLLDPDAYADLLAEE
jgi:glycine cleavage system H protein